MAKDVFATTIQKTNDLLVDIEEKLGWNKEERHQSYMALRIVLHALRDRLPVNEAVGLGAQLTTLVRGIYYEGWRPSAVPIKMTKQEFLQRVQNEFTFSLDASIQELTEIVIESIGEHIDPKEAEKLANTLPKKFEDLFV